MVWGGLEVVWGVSTDPLVRLMKEGKIYLFHRIQLAVFHLKLHFNLKRMMLISLKSSEE